MSNAAVPASAMMSPFCAFSTTTAPLFGFEHAAGDAVALIAGKLALVQRFLGERLLSVEIDGELHVAARCGRPFA